MGKVNENTFVAAVYTSCKNTFEQGTKLSAASMQLICSQEDLSYTKKLQGANGRRLWVKR